ncbi:MAG TPA: response regulator [Anaeromyxobacteraceae bacterium]|nr:response regulator [Anaeromyxobacteraceae bacterium]
MQVELLKILVVEDDEDNRELLAELLRLEGHLVEAAADAERALELAAREPFDVVVADVGLPRMDGIALARELRRSAPRVAVVAVSGYGDGAELADACGRDVDAVVVKPADPARLMAALAAAVRARRAGRGAP